MPEPVIQFDDYEFYLYKLIRSLHKTTGIPVVELRSIVFLAFSESVHQYDPKRGRFVAFFLRFVTGRVDDFIQAEAKALRRDLYNRLEVPDCERCTIIRDLIQNSSSDVKMVCNAIFASPADFLVHNSPKLSRGALFRYLRHEGWTFDKIWSTFRELKGLVGELAFS